MYFWSKHHFLSILENENNNNKNKMWATSWQNQLNSTLIRVLDVRMKKAWVFSYPLSAQADLRWTHSHFVGFVMRRLKWHYLLIFIYIIIYTRRTLSLFFVIYLVHLSHFCDKTSFLHVLLRLTSWDTTRQKHQNDLCAQRRLSLRGSAVWSESSLSARISFRFLATHTAHSEDSDQTGRTCHFVVLRLSRVLSDSSK